MTNNIVYFARKGGLYVIRRAFMRGACMTYLEYIKTYTAEHLLVEVLPSKLNQV